MRVEWQRARARALRFKEEVVFVQEEQRRVIETLEKTAVEWDLRQDVDVELTTCPVVAEGLGAYAAEQASLYRRLCAKFKGQWNMGVTESTVARDVGDEGDFSNVHFAYAGNESDDESPRARGHDTDDDE